MNRFVYAVGLLALAACQPAAGPAVDLAAEEQAVRAESMKWLEAAKTKNAAAEMAFIAPDAVFHRPHEQPLVGAAAIEAYFTKQITDNPKAAVTWTTESVTVAASGDVAIEVGMYHVTGIGPKADIEDKGNFVTIWKKVGGQWKATRDIGSTTVPEAGMAHHE